MLTLAGLGLGFMAALAAGKGDEHQALGLLAVAALADALAGRAAQSLQLSTAIGAELDSLASMMVWGVACALLAYEGGLQVLGQPGTWLAGLAALSFAWRLCKGDVQTGCTEYRGLPVTPAGVALAAAVALDASTGTLAALALVLAVAMLGPWRYPRLKLRLALQAPFFLSLGLAAFGLPWGWILPGVASLAYALFAPLFLNKTAPAPDART